MCSGRDDWTLLQPGFIRKSAGRRLFSLTAAYRSRPRPSSLPVPRHPPYALTILTEEHHNLSLCRFQGTRGRCAADKTALGAQSFKTEQACDAQWLLEHALHQEPIDIVQGDLGSQWKHMYHMHYVTVDRSEPCGAGSPTIQKGGDPAAPSGTATLLRLHPNHRIHLRRLPPLRVSHRLRVSPTFVVTGGVQGLEYSTRHTIWVTLATPPSWSRVSDLSEL